MDGENYMTHYDGEYFEWQKKIGEFGATVDLFKFRKYIKATDRVIDFGCGGGFMLKALGSAAKIGVEINDLARKFAINQGINTVKDASEIEDNWADVIISNNALEHALCPFNELKKLRSKLKSGGKIVFVVPNEKKGSWKPNDINQHLYTWTPLNIGNLFIAAGFTIEKIDIIPIWPPKPMQVRKIFGLRLFYLFSKISGDFRRWCQIRVVAAKPLL
jgi:SAM-dependent methyltransferase